MAVITRREFLMAGLGASAAACTTQHIMRRPISPRPKPIIGISILPSYRSQIPTAPQLVKLLEAFTGVIEPIWGVSANFVALDHPIQDPRVWNFMFAEDEIACEGALAYHDWDPNKGANPYALVEVPQCLRDGGVDQVTIAATHELVEMLADPGCSYWADAVPLTSEDERSPSAMQAAKLLAYETADPVEDAWFKLLGHKVTDFVYPAYFEPFPDGRVDHLGAITSPHQIAVGGYQIVRSGTDVHQVVNIGFGPDEWPAPQEGPDCANPNTGKPICHRARRILAKYGR